MTKLEKFRKFGNFLALYSLSFVEVKHVKYTSSFYLWNFWVFARVKLGKSTSPLNMSLGRFTILENLPCLSCVYSFSGEIHMFLTCVILEFCLEGVYMPLWDTPQPPWVKYFTDGINVVGISVYFSIWSHLMKQRQLFLSPLDMATLYSMGGIEYGISRA